MSFPKGSCIFAQSGGPTAVINASAYGVIRTALDAEEITHVYGAEHGILGVINDVLFDMSQEDPQELALLKNTPSSELGSCRYKLKDYREDASDYEKILAIFKKHDVRYFFYNGGNDSMDTCHKISEYMQNAGWQCRVMGVPKTIDNDLNGTDHCPGFGSAARYIATSCMEVAKDSSVYPNGQVTIVEIMGRHAGWLAGSAALATEAGAGPDLVYLPERIFNRDRFIADVTGVYQKNGGCLVAVSEGLCYENGCFVSEASTSASDGFGHAQLGGLAQRLSELVKQAIPEVKVRAIELSLLQRCGAHLASACDLQEAEAAGVAAVQMALAGDSGKMIAFSREEINEQYSCRLTAYPLSQVANAEKKVPDAWINEQGNFVTREFLDYVRPLIQGQPERIYQNGLPRYPKLKLVKA